MSKLREKLNKIYAEEAKVSFANGTVTISDRGWNKVLAAVVEAVEGMKLPTDRIVEIAAKHSATMIASITAGQEVAEAQRATIVRLLKEG